MTASKRHTRAASALIAVFALALVLAACGSSSSNGSSSSSGSKSSGSVTLNGSGSTFQKTFLDTVIGAYHGVKPSVTVNYAGGGSGKGKTDLQTKTVDFAGTDSLIKDADKSKYQGGAVLYFPTVAAPITVSYNVSGVSNLKLSASTLAKIFTAKITKWNAQEIAADNPGVNLPSTDVVIVHRADASGTTNNFSTYLSKAAPADFTLTPGDTVNWPSNSQAGQGNAGVASTVKSTSGAIGYVDYADAVASGLKFASIKNKAGEFQPPTIAGAAAAVAGATVKPDLTYSPLDAPGAGVYPITSPTWIIVYANQTDQAKGQAIKDFLTYILNEGQGLAEQAKYAKLPASLQQKAQAQLNQIQIGGSTTTTT